MGRIKSTGLWPGSLLLLTNGLLLAWILFQPETQAQYYTGIDTFIASVELLAAALGFAAFMTLRRRRSPLQWMPLLLALGLLFTCIGQAINVFYDLSGGETPYPSIADIFYLGAYPMYVWGILLFPKLRLTAAARARLGADGLVMMLALGTLGWYFLLGPTILQGQGSLPFQLTSAAYPAADLLLMCCLVLLYSKRSHIHRDLRLPLVLLAGGILCISLADSYDGVFNLNNLLTSNFEFLGWSTGYLLIAMAMLVVRSRSHLEGAASLESPSWKQSLLPYMLVAAVLPLIVVIWIAGDTGIVASGTYVGCMLLIAVVLLRQILAIKTVQQANTRLEALATSDPLTKLPNHRALLESLEKETGRARRNGHPLAVLFFDGDHFKRVNDIYGHSVGDAVLQELGRRVNDSLRAGDTLGRYGGEEFMALLPETNMPHACDVAERMRVAVAAHPFAVALVTGGVHLTISIGVATFPTDGQMVSEVVEKADQAMYWAKRLGRNQIRTTLEAQQASQDSALAATIYNLERRDEQAVAGQSVAQAVRANQLNTIQSLMELLDVRDQGISTHAYQVSDLAAAIARELELGQDAVFAVSTAALLHDIGKIAIPDRLMQKVGPLTGNEWTLIKQHPELGAQILEVSPYLHNLIPAVGHHHENWDGTGYPDGLAGENIPLAARIIRVSEAYCAMLTARPYQAQRTGAMARSELQRCSGTHFDPSVVQAALQVVLRTEAEAEIGREVSFVS